MIYPDAVHDEDKITRLVDAAGDVPVNIGMGFGVRSRPTTPLIPLRRLGELGVARVSCPRMMSASALSGMKKALEVMKQCIDTGEAADRPDLLISMEELTDLVGYRRISKMEQELLSSEQLERKYGLEEGDFVIRQH
jgi:2-methylisocitrate lyase-like PEP mutase family enzyme